MLVADPAVRYESLARGIYGAMCQKNKSMSRILDAILFSDVRLVPIL